MEQDKIDVARATPLAPKARRGAPFWLQLLLSAVVVAAALAGGALVNGTLNRMLAEAGVALPLLTAAEAPAATGGPQAGPRPGQGPGTARPGGGAGGRSAVVIAAPVGEGTINDRLTAIGEGSAIHSVTVSTASGGTLLSVAVEPGETVVAGALLATLDAGTQQIAYDRARLASADADAALARARELANAKSLSNAQLAAAQLSADTAQLELRNAGLALEQRTIRAPVGGTVGLIQASPGNLINAQTVLTTIEDASRILVNFWVPERYAPQIRRGLEVTAASVALPGLAFTGTVSATDNRIDPQSRTLQVQAVLDNPDGVIRPGMSFSVGMAFAGQTFPTVDPLSIQWSNEGAYVWKVVDGRVTRGMVEIVQRNSDGVLVHGDVVAGDQVVTEGVLQLSEGLAVRLLDEG